MKVNFYKLTQNFMIVLLLFSPVVGFDHHDNDCMFEVSFGSFEFTVSEPVIQEQDHDTSSSYDNFSSSSSYSEQSSSTSSSCDSRSSSSSSSSCSEPSERSSSKSHDYGCSSDSYIERMREHGFDRVQDSYDRDQADKREYSMLQNQPSYRNSYDFNKASKNWDSYSYHNYYDSQASSLYLACRNIKEYFLGKSKSRIKKEEYLAILVKTVEQRKQILAEKEALHQKILVAMKDELEPAHQKHQLNLQHGCNQEFLKVLHRRDDYFK